MNSIAQQKKCTRCNGNGQIRRFHYYKNGVCFRCEGTGIDPSAQRNGHFILKSKEHADQYAHFQVQNDTCVVSWFNDNEPLHQETLTRLEGRLRYKQSLEFGYIKG